MRAKLCLVLTMAALLPASLAEASSINNLTWNLPGPRWNCAQAQRGSANASMTDFVRCELGSTIKAIPGAKFAKADAVTSSASQMLKLAADYDAGRITIYTFRAHYRQAFPRFATIARGDDLFGPVPIGDANQGQGYQDSTMAIPDATRSQ